MSKNILLTQTRALLVDAYRELQSKKLFWITLGLSGIVVAAFGAVGFNASGFTIFGKLFRSPYLNTNFLPLDVLYKNLFIQLGVNSWLSMFAIILALVSTAPLFPDFLSSGAVDLYLARPLGRLRLFMTKYVSGLLFVALQILIFSVASFLVIGLRAGVWVPGIFLAVPIVTLMFSYLWGLCALFGVLTRSTIASLMLTLLAWFLGFGIHASESALLFFSLAPKVEARELDRDIVRYNEQLATLTTQPASTQPGSFAAARVKQLRLSLDNAQTERASISDNLTKWHSLAYAIKWPMPKTTETVALLERWLNDQFKRPGRRPEPSEDENRDKGPVFGNPRVQRATGAEVAAVMKSRSPTWVIGTSLLFEAGTLALAGYLFCRRDY